MAETNSDTLVNEHSKSVYDYLKHLTTLSTGSIVIIATFLEKLFTNPEWKFMVILSVGGFLLCVITSTFAYTIVLADNSGKKKIPLLISILGGGAFLMAWLGFLIGVFSLSVFAIKNLS